MKLSGLLIIFSLATTIILLIAGAYVTIDNIIHPQGNLFEGIVSFVLGILLSMMMLIASTLGTVIQTFTNIYTQQAEIQKKINDLNKPSSISDILRNGLFGNSNPKIISITNLETGETLVNDDRINKPLSGDNPIESFLSNMLDNGKKLADKDNLAKLNIEQLEEELTKAVSKEDFEKAKEIRDLIKIKKDDKKDDKKD